MGISLCPGAWPQSILYGHAGFIIALNGTGREHGSRQSLAIVPGHPFRGPGGQFLSVALQLDQIVEGVGAT